MRRAVLLWLMIVLAVPAVARAAELVVPTGPLERRGTADVTLRWGYPLTGEADLALRWTDSAGRLVEDRHRTVALLQQDQAVFSLDLSRAVVRANHLAVRLTLGGKSGRREEAEASFATVPAEEDWWDYQIIMWQPQNARQYAALKGLGVTAAPVIPAKPDQTAADRSAAMTALLMQNDIRPYIENIGTDFYAPYHRWTPDKAVNAAFLAAKERYRADPASREPLQRQPSLSDPLWLRRVQTRLEETARRFAPLRPLYYDLGDETGIADLSAYWDFDLSPESLAGLRDWLRGRYGDLAALNRQWGRDFPSWEAVWPETAAQAMRRSDGNFSAWADFREWMDVAYARALRVGTDAVHSVDPRALVAIEGGQAPGWGGYDYTLLAGAVDAFELYDLGNNIDIVHALAPDAPLLTTTPGHGPGEKARVWRELLHGNRGLILWDEKNDYARPDGSLGPRGRETADYYRQLRDGLGARIIGASAAPAPIAIHYSPASMRADWIARMIAEGPEGLRQASISQVPTDPFTRLRQSLCLLAEDLGQTYRFLSPAQLAAGTLRAETTPLLILPQSDALSEAEGTAVRRFLAQGGTVVAVGVPGGFDEHVRRRATPLLADLFPPSSRSESARPVDGGGRAILLNAPVAGYYDLRDGKGDGWRARLKRAVSGDGRSLLDLMDGLFRQAGLPRPLAEEPDGRPARHVETHLYTSGPMSLVALLDITTFPRADQGAMPAVPVPAAPPSVRPLFLTLPEERQAYDLRTGKNLGWGRRFALSLIPGEPAFVALFPRPPDDFSLSLPERIAAGETARLQIVDPAAKDISNGIYHASVADPAGGEKTYYSGNLRNSGNGALLLLPLAVDDSPGLWRITVTSLQTGLRKTAKMEVLSKR